MKKAVKNNFVLFSICCVLLCQCGIVYATNEIPVVKNIKEDLAYLISCDVSPEWAPDVLSQKDKISVMLSDFTKLDAEQKSAFTADELTSLKQYFTTYYKNEGLDISSLDVIFNLTNTNTPHEGLAKNSSEADVTNVVPKDQAVSDTLISAPLVVATLTNGSDSTLLIIFIIIASTAVVGAIWYIFSKETDNLSATLTSHLSHDETAFAINYVNSKSNSQQEAKKKIIEAINALQSEKNSDR